MLHNFLELHGLDESSVVHLHLLKVLFPLKLILLENAALTFKIHQINKRYIQYNLLHHATSDSKCIN